MNSMLVVSRSKPDVRLLWGEFGGMTAYDLSDDWRLFEIRDLSTLSQILREDRPCISCVDITGQPGVSAAEGVRASLAQTMLILIASPELSPMTYILPTTLPAGILLKPLDRRQIRKTFSPLLQMVRQKNVEDLHKGESFSVTSHGTVHRVPLKDILYFEARNKKLYLSTKDYEIKFYDSLERVQEKLPPDFLRCHKSFIVNRNWIDRVQLAQNLIIMYGDSVRIPISRTMKPQLKEVLK